LEESGPQENRAFQSELKHFRVGTSVANGKGGCGLNRWNSFLKGLAMMKTFTKILVVMTVGIGLAVMGIVSAGARSSIDDPFDAATAYKTKCVACHGPKAEKKFDAAKTDDEHLQIILKGKKMEKPPNMPAYEEKGITAEQAKSLLEYMKSIRQ